MNYIDSGIKKKISELVLVLEIIGKEHDEVDLAEKSNKITVSHHMYLSKKKNFLLAELFIIKNEIEELVKLFDVAEQEDINYIFDNYQLRGYIENDDDLIENVCQWIILYRIEYNNYIRLVGDGKNQKRDYASLLEQYDKLAEKFKIAYHLYVPAEKEDITKAFVAQLRFLGVQKEVISVFMSVLFDRKAMPKNVRTTVGEQYELLQKVIHEIVYKN